MKIFLIIVAAVIMFYFYRRFMRKIDKDEQKGLNLLVGANYLKHNYGELIYGLLAITGYEVSLESFDSIIISNNQGCIKKEFVIQQSYSNIVVIQIVDNTPLKEWKFKRIGSTAKQMLNVILNDIDYGTL